MLILNKGDILNISQKNVKGVAGDDAEGVGFGLRKSGENSEYVVFGYDEKTSSDLGKLIVETDWAVNSFGPDEKFDVDAVAFMLGSNGKCPTENEFIFYKNLIHPTGTVEHSGDSSFDGRESGKEQIKVDLSKIPEKIASIAFTVTIYDAKNRMQNFTTLKHAYMRVLIDGTGVELCRYDICKDFNVETAVITGELFRKPDGWKLKVIGRGFSSELDSLCRYYGIVTV